MVFHLPTLSELVPVSEDAISVVKKGEEKTAEGTAAELEEEKKDSPSGLAISVAKLEGYDV